MKKPAFVTPTTEVSVLGIASYCESDENEVEIENEKSRDFLNKNAAYCEGLQLYATAEDKGFEPSTGFPAPDFESGSNATKPNKNKGSRKPATNVLQPESTPTNEAPETDLLSIAKKSLSTCRRDIEKLIDATDNSDEYTLGLLGPILSKLRSAQSTLERLQQHTD